MYDLIIIGASAAGASAAIYAARANLNFLIIAQDQGGNCAKAGLIENYLGFKSLPGNDLSQKFEEHFLSYNPEILNEAVELLSKQEEGFLIKTSTKELKTKTVIVASGAHHRKVNVPGEDKFLNKGISYCETCDGALFKDKNVAVLGGGYSAVKAAFSLAKIASQVHILNIDKKLRAEEIYLKKLPQIKNINILNQVKTQEFLGDQFLKGLRYKDLKTNEAKELKLDGAFIYIGLLPNTDFIDSQLNVLNDNNELVVNKLGKTKIKGLFGAGDVIDLPFKQICIASGDGAKACLSAIEYLRKH